MEIAKFNATIAKMGDRYIINIPKALNPQIAPHTGKRVTITIKESGESECLA